MKINLDDYGFLVRAVPDYGGGYTEIKGKQERNYRVTIKLQPIGFDGFKPIYTINLTHQMLFASAKDAAEIVNDIRDKKVIDLAFWWWSVNKAKKRVVILDDKVYSTPHQRTAFKVFLNAPTCKLSDYAQRVIEATGDDEDDPYA